MRKAHKHFSRILSLLLALTVLLSTGCGAQRNEETPPAEVLPPVEEVPPAAETEQESTVEPEAEAEEETGPKVYADLQEALDDMAEKYGAVGMELAVVKGGELYGAYSSGWAVLDSKPITNEHLMLAGSISKVVTGIATLLAYEDGLVDLDADISEYWGVEVVNPYYPDVPITIRTLLNHTSSLVTPDADYSRKYEDVKAFLSDETSFMNLKPGDATSFEYHNYGYDILGMTVELASGKYIDEILEERLFQHMDIRAGFFSDNLDKSLLMANYGESDKISMTAGTHANAVRAEFPGYNGINYCGRFKTSAETLAKLIVLLTNDGVYDGQQLMRPESVAMLENYQFQPGSTYYQCEASQRYRESFYDRDGVYYHTGDIYGNYTCFAYHPESGDGVVILTTGATNLIKDERTNLSGCYSEITGIAFDYLLTIPGEAN